ncbi:RagB/SusD family nutrient uptake outer membrane protein [Wenyingzhuangia sp. IMCC45574]
MKYFNKISIILLSSAALLTTSCNEEEFLTEINPNATTKETFWETKDQFNSGLASAYGAAQLQNISGGELANEFQRSDEGGTESWYGIHASFRNLTYNDASPYVTGKWNNLYTGIFRTNQVIARIADDSKVNESTFGDNERAYIEGQARFLRAFYYFELVHTYGKGIIQVIDPQGEADYNQPMSTLEEITNSIIIPDLQFAQENLPLTWSEDEKARVTSGSASSLLGKVYLYDEQWTAAAAEFKKVIDSGVYALTPNIIDNFSKENEFNQESIFEVNYSSEIAPGVPGGNFGQGSEASTMGRQVGQLSFGGYNTVLVTYFLHELFVNDEVDNNNIVNDGNAQSKRMTASIVPINGEGLYYGLPINEKPGWAYGQSAYIKKHANWLNDSAEDNNNRSGINFRHIRYADVLLMYAEAILNDTGDFSSAITYIDQIRARAGVKTIQQYLDDNAGQFPQLHISSQVTGTPHPLVTPSKETILTHIQRVERPLELCYEGHRWKDLVRWGIVREVFDDLKSDEDWRFANEASLDLTGPGIAPLFIAERIRPDFSLAAANYNSSQHDYFPIPIQETQANQELQN